MGVVEDLERLAELHAAGAITDQEWSDAKRRVLNPHLGPAAVPATATPPVVPSSPVPPSGERSAATGEERSVPSWPPAPTHPGWSKPTRVLIAIAGTVIVLGVGAYFTFFSSDSTSSSGTPATTTNQNRAACEYYLVADASTKLDKSDAEMRAIAEGILSRSAGDLATYRAGIETEIATADRYLATELSSGLASDVHGVKDAMLLLIDGVDHHDVDGMVHGLSNAGQAARSFTADCAAA